MAKQLTIEAERLTTAPPEVVWALVLDAGRYPEWGPWDEAGYQTQGEYDSPLGVGAVRWLRRDGETVTEEILEVEVGRRLAWRIVAGLPVRNHRAEVSLTRVGPSTHIHWAAWWDRTLSSRAVHKRLHGELPTLVADLAAAAEVVAG